MFSWPGPDAPITMQSERTVELKVEEDGDLHIALHNATGDKAGVVVCEIPAQPEWCEIRTTVFSWTPTRFPFHTGTARKLTFGQSPVITVIGKACAAPCVTDCVPLAQEDGLDTERFKARPTVLEWSDFDDCHAKKQYGFCVNVVERNKAETTCKRSSRRRPNFRGAAICSPVVWRATGTQQRNRLGNASGCT
jgi:hypothetical protein